MSQSMNVAESPSTDPNASRVMPGKDAVHRPSAMRAELAMVWTLWRRDMLRLQRERSRWLGVVLQPLLFWFLIGSGMADNFQIEGEEQSYLTFFFPGVLVMILLFTSIFGTIALIEDRQSGFLQGVLVAPGSRSSLVLGKIAGVTSIAILQAALFLVLSPWTGYPFAAVSWGVVAAAVVLSCVFMTSVCFVMAWLLHSTQAYHALMSVVLIPLWVLSGAMFPAGDGVLSTVMQFNPMTYSVDALRAGLEGSGGALTPLLVLLVLSVAGVVFAAAISRRQGGRAA